MAYTKDDLKKIEDALLKFADGKRVSELTFSDRKVKFEAATLGELTNLRDEIRNEVRRTTKGRNRFLRLRSGGKGVR